MASAQDGWLPAILGKRSKKRGIPYALGFLYVAGVIPVVLGIDLNDMVTMQLVPLGTVIMIGSCLP